MKTSCFEEEIGQITPLVVSNIALFLLRRSLYREDAAKDVRRKSDGVLLNILKTKKPPILYKDESLNITIII